MQFLNSSTSCNVQIFRELLGIANNLELIDNHAHPILEPEPEHFESWKLPRLENILSEATPVFPGAPSMTSRSSLAHSRSIRDMNLLLNKNRRELHEYAEVNDFESNFSSDEKCVEEARKKLGIWPLARICVETSKISAVLIDDGLSSPPKSSFISYSKFHDRLGIPVAKRILRLESEAEACLSMLMSVNEFSLWQCGSEIDSSSTGQLHNYYASRFLEEFRKRIDPLPPDVVSFKSASAYRSGLKISLNRSKEEIDSALKELLHGIDSPSNQFHIRLEHPVIIDAVVKMGFEVARKYKIPIQFHCGFGDTDLDILKANPGLLRNLFHECPDVAVVLLHAAYPFSREAGYLASCYPSVYVDFGLAVPLLSVRGMVSAVQAIIEIAPLNKVLYSSDAHSAPDVLFLSAVWGRKVLAAVLAEGVLCGDLSKEEARNAIGGILHNNALELYRLHLQVGE